MSDLRIQKDRLDALSEEIASAFYEDGYGIRNANQLGGRYYVLVDTVKRLLVREARNNPATECVKCGQVKANNLHADAALCESYMKDRERECANPAEHHTFDPGV